ncbi:MAG: DinB family protein [Chloroflexota bacterium]
MNLDDVLKYGHRTVTHALDGLTEDQANVNGVCGHWSVREIVAHLASHELLMVEVLASFLDASAPMPTLNAYFEQKSAFNDIEVEKRQALSFADLVSEYEAAFAKTRELAAQVPVGKRREVGAIPWYGAEYDLEDLAAYSNYAHKREHCAQIAVYRDTLN